MAAPETIEPEGSVTVPESVAETWAEADVLRTKKQASVRVESSTGRMSFCLV
jgi:hypothetical protein